MIQTEPAPQPPITDPAQEQLAQARQHATKVLLGHGAIAGSAMDEPPIDEAYVAAGIDQIDAHLAQQASAPAHTSERPDNRTSDANSIAAAHNEATLANDIFDAHTEALAENEQFDLLKAHEEALAMNDAFDERAAAKSTKPKTTEQKKQKDQEQTESNDADPDQNATAEASAAQGPGANQAARTEASRLLEQAGMNANMVDSSSVITDPLDPTHSIIVMNGTDAKVITPAPGGTPHITEYHYDKVNGIVTIGDKQFDVAHGARSFQETDLKPWQTYDDVKELPSIVADRFGIERLISAK